jgi:hypothetical protein
MFQSHVITPLKTNYPTLLIKADNLENWMKLNIENWMKLNIENWMKLNKKIVDQGSCCMLQYGCFNKNVYSRQWGSSLTVCARMIVGSSFCHQHVEVVSEVSEFIDDFWKYPPCPHKSVIVQGVGVSPIFCRWLDPNIFVTQEPMQNFNFWKYPPCPPKSVKVRGEGGVPDNYLDWNPNIFVTFEPMQNC